MILSNGANKKDVSLTLNVNDLSNVTSHKFLGVMIDETLKFDIHIIKICTKGSQPIGGTRRVSNMVPDNVLHSLYYALACSRITYAICAWGSTYPTALKRLKFWMKKQCQWRIFLRTDLIAVFFNMTRLINISSYVKCPKLYAMTNL